MKNNTNFYRQKKPSQEAINAMIDLYAKNKNLKSLIKVFDLDIRTATVQPLDTETVKPSHRETVREILKQNTMSTAKKTVAKKFNTEVEESNMEPFVKFENEDDAHEGIITGETKTIKDSKCFIMEIDGVRHVVPSNVQLNRKLENVCKIHSEDIEAGNGVEVRIEYLGLIKIEGVANKVKNFKVLTA